MTVLAAVCAAVSLLSFVCLFLNRRAFEPLPRGRCPERWPRVSVLIPARNEERDLERILRAHLAADYPGLEVIVVDDCSTDGTAGIIRRLAAASPRLVAVEGSEPPSGWLGKPHALWQAAQRASGEWLLFVDADVAYGPETLKDAVGHAICSGIDLLTLLPRLVAVGFWEGVLMPNLCAVLYLGPGFLMNRDDFRRGAVGGGSGNLVSRRAYEAVGGHAALKNSIIDDIGLATRVRRAGFRVRAASAFDRVSVRMYRGFGEIVEGFTKNVGFVLPRSAMVAVAVFLSCGLTLFPYGVLLFGRSARGAVALSLVAIGSLVLARILVARLVQMAVWSAFFHPLMIAVWGGIGLRSVWRRSVTGRVEWRGRSTPAKEAR